MSIPRSIIIKKSTLTALTCHLPAGHVLYGVRPRKDGRFHIVLRQDQIHFLQSVAYENDFIGFDEAIQYLVSVRHAKHARATH